MEVLVLFVILSYMVSASLTLYTLQCLYEPENVVFCIEVLILVVNTMYVLFCFFKLFPIGCIWLYVVPQMNSTTDTLISSRIDETVLFISCMLISMQSWRDGSFQYLPNVPGLLLSDCFWNGVHVQEGLCPQRPGC